MCWKFSHSLVVSSFVPFWPSDLFPQSVNLKKLMPTVTILSDDTNMLASFPKLSLYQWLHYMTFIGTHRNIVLLAFPLQKAVERFCYRACGAGKDFSEDKLMLHEANGWLKEKILLPTLAKLFQWDYFGETAERKAKMEQSHCHFQELYISFWVNFPKVNLYTNCCEGLAAFFLSKMR